MKHKLLKATAVGSVLAIAISMCACSSGEVQARDTTSGQEAKAAASASADGAETGDQPNIKELWQESTRDAVCVLRITDTETSDTYNAPLTVGTETKTGKDDAFAVSWDDTKATVTCPDGVKVKMWSDAKGDGYKVEWHKVADYNGKGALKTGGKR